MSQLTVAILSALGFVASSTCGYLCGYEITKPSHIPSNELSAIIMVAAIDSIFLITVFDNLPRLMVALMLLSAPLHCYLVWVFNIDDGENDEDGGPTDPDWDDFDRIRAQWRNKQPV